MLHAGISWIAEGYSFGPLDVIQRSSPKVAWDVDSLKESRDTPSPGPHPSRSQSPDQPGKHPRVRSAPIVRSTLYTDEHSVRPHCKCTCHLENFHGIYPNDVIKKYLPSSSSRPESRASSTATPTSSARYRGSRPGSSVSAVYPRDHSDLEVSTERSPRPWSAPPPSSTKSYLKSRILRQRLTAQLNTRGATHDKFRGRHARCYGHSHVHEKLIRSRPTEPCSDCGDSCVLERSSVVGRCSSPSRDIEEYLRGKHYAKLAEIVGYPLRINMRNNFQPLPKHNNIRQGTVPHFCNFIGNKALHARDTTPSPIGHHGNHTDRGSSAPATGRSRSLLPNRRPKSSGSLGRPVSPRTVAKTSEHDTVSEVEVEVPRVEVVRRLSEEDVDPRPSPGTPEIQAVEKLNTPRPPPPAPVDGSDRKGVGVKPATSKHDRSKCKPKVPVPRKKDASVLTGGSGDSGRHDVGESEGGVSNQEPSTVVREHPGSVSSTPHSTAAARGPPAKKERRLLERQRTVTKEATIEEANEEAAPSVPEPVPEQKDIEIASPEEPKVEVKAPELPKFVPKKEEATKPLIKPAPKRTSIVSPNFCKPNVTEILEQQLRQRQFYDFPKMADHKPEIVTTQKSVSNTWTQGRLALSQQSSRFELPMDMKLLETMQPVEYLSKYCVVTSKRKWLYEKIYLKHRDAKLGGLNLKGLEKALKEALVDTISPEEVVEMVEMTRLTENSKVDQKLFVGIAAMTERLLYPRFLTEETNNLKDHKKEKIECADFCGLEWKFHGVDVNPYMRKILESL